jgi:WD40 repeat protein
LLSAGGEDGTIRLWDVSTGVEIRRLTGHTGGVRTMAFSPDGRRALSGSGSLAQKGLSGFFGVGDAEVIDPSMRLWDVDTGRQLLCFDDFTSPVWSVAFSPDGLQAISGSGHTRSKGWFGGSEPIDCTVRIWNLPT